MNWLDLLFVSILAGAVLYGLFRGLIREIFSLLSIIAGFLLASRLYKIAARVFEGLTPHPYIAYILFFLAIFVLTSFAIGLLGRFLRRLILALTPRALGVLDYLAGAAFGLVKGSVIVFTIALLVVSYIPGRNRVIRDSVLLPHLIKVIRPLSPLLPLELRERFHRRAQELETLRQEGNFLGGPGLKGVDQERKSVA